MQNSPYRKAELKLRELNQRIRVRKLKSAILLLLVMALCLLGAFLIYRLYQSISFSNFQVLESFEREDAPGTRFAEFQGNVLKYNNDGAFYMGVSNQLIWSQAYEMRDPMVDSCDDYLVLYDRGGKQIYIMNTTGPVGQIMTNMPIRKVNVANQGTVAILMENEGAGYLQLYDREGNFLAEGELHTQNSGYPLDMSLSNDARKMAVSLLDINDGTIKSTLAFYDFGAVGQNQIDNMVGTFHYPDIVMPRIVYLNNDVLAAFGDKRLILYETRRIPSVKKEIEQETQVQSIFYNDRYIGLVSRNEVYVDSQEIEEFRDSENRTKESLSGEQPYGMSIYDLNGSLVRRIGFSMEYKEIDFLQNNQICIRNDMECAIYTLRGTLRFHYNFDRNIWKVMSDGRGGRRYILIMDQVTEKIRLRR